MLNEIQFGFNDAGLYGQTHEVTAQHPVHGTVGSMHWGSPNANEGWVDPGEVQSIRVKPEFRRQGIGSAMYRFAQSKDTNLHHSEYQTDDGKSWAPRVGG